MLTSAIFFPDTTSRVRATHGSGEAVIYVRYGSYQHALSEAAVSIRQESAYNAGGQQQSVREVWNITGLLQANTSALLTAAVNNLKAAYKIQGQNLGLFYDDGTASSHGVISASTLGGVRVTRGPDFPEWKGAEGATMRTYEIELAADYPALNVLLSLFEETLEFEGGGPRDVFLQPLNGLPQKQRVAESTPYRAVQRGSATGYRGWPLPMAPIFPDAEHRDQRHFSRRSPKRDGPVGAPFYSEFPIEWWDIPTRTKRPKSVPSNWTEVQGKWHEMRCPVAQKDWEQS